MRTKFNAVFAALLAALCPLSALADELLDIHKEAARLIRVSVTGFTGEADSVLKYDLSVLGMEITPPADAEYLVTGRDNGRIEGSLTAAGSNRPLWVRAYASGRHPLPSPRLRRRHRQGNSPNGAHFPGPHRLSPPIRRLHGNLRFRFRRL